MAVVGAGPAGLECATSISHEHEVALFDERDRPGGHLVIATSAPNRHGWQALLDYYQCAVDGADNIEVRFQTAAGPDLLAEFDHVVVAIGSDEVLPDLPGVDRAMSSSQFIANGPLRRQAQRS